MKKETKKYFRQTDLGLVYSKSSKKNTHKYELKINKTYGFEFYEELDRSIKEFFDTLEDSGKPTLFKIVGDFELLKAAGEEDWAAFLVAVVNIFAGYIVIPKTSSGNGRLAVPKSMDGIRITSMTLRDMANRLMKFPEFRIEVLDLKGNSVYEVM